ncbi:sentrin-specific protease 7b isoform X2 [Denticeps clupeoides]|uniref:Ubiquitin-like protease family profile domain-containing protein n=1 Tax=Denticeps clupeoides TaxID=299321 RepID=A0AAY4BKI2_9TELE|nr:sentrin-specific protease 7-like isoform X2 [Denticeps clupeoides]
MGTPFRIPKRKQPSEASSIQMQSPLTRLQDTRPCESQCSYGVKVATGRLSFTLSLKTDRGHDSEKKHDFMTKAQTAKGTTSCSIDKWSSLSDGRRRLTSQTPNNGPHSSPGTSAQSPELHSWRPKRASDSLCSKGKLKETHDSPWLRRYDSEQVGKSRSCSLPTASLSPWKETLKSSNTEDQWQDVLKKGPERRSSDFGSEASEDSASCRLKQKTEEKELGEENVPQKQAKLSVKGSSPRLLGRSAPTSPSLSPWTREPDPPRSHTQDIQRKSSLPFLNQKPLRKPKPVPTEPIVLSSDDERGDECASDVTAKQHHAEQASAEKGVPYIMEIPFSALHVGVLKALSSGTVVITDDGISIPLKDQACPFLVLVLHEHMQDVQIAKLTSIMDLLGLRACQPRLSSPLSWADGLSLIRCRSQDDHLLSLLGQVTETGSASHPAVQDKESPARVRASRAQSQSQPSVPSFGSKSVDCSQRRNQGFPRRLIQYPPPPSKGGITVTTEDLECLKRGEFLNDVIIDFYLKFLLQEKASQEMKDRSHIFSSFFYKQLTRKDTSNEGAAQGSSLYRRHQRVRTWTRHVDLFNKDFIFVPVNQEAHWYLVVICFPGLETPQHVEWRGPALEGGSGVKRKCEAQASSQGNANATKGRSSSDSQRLQRILDCCQKSCQRNIVCKKPCILLLDSLKLSLHERIYQLLRDYLQVEWELRKGTPRHFTADNMKGSHCKVPQQDNSSDCGLYLLQYVESFLQNPVVHFELPVRLEHWFPRQEVKRKREEIRELVLHLYRREGGRQAEEPP